MIVEVPDLVSSNKKSIIRGSQDDGVYVSLENKEQLSKIGSSAGCRTGFGLFLSKKIMEVYGWAIEENSDLGKGAKFTIKLMKQPRIRNGLRT